ncbi:MAG: hypothetical protein JWO85_2268 [Candidatus Eremiobacteraeota bacterium]|jgi:hypothetical protein|nr:hypothetical protein [Candidatus Eremiobacteraeota bacterium]
MTLPRIAACITIPAALLLSACGGGSTSPFVNNATQGTAQVRFVQADPKFGPVDIYFFQSAGGQTTTPAFSGLAFGEASDYQAQTAVPNTLVARAAGSASSSAAVTACNLPPLANANYSVVIADQNGAPNCMVFQDQNYSTTLQYRMHYAAALYAAANPTFATVSYGVGTTPAAFTAQGTSGVGGFLGSTNPITQSGSTGNLANAAGTVFGVGPSAAAGATVTALTSLPATSIFAPSSFTEPDTAGSLPYSTYAGVSLYAIDCTSAIPGTPAPIACRSGLALIGVFDSK